MNGLTHERRTLIRSIVIATCVAVLALAAAQRAEATQTDHEVDPSEAAAFQKAMCEAAGGKATIEVSRFVGYYPTTYVSCAGGLLDGMYCVNTVLATACSYPVVRSEAPPAVGPTGGVEAEPEPTVPTTEVAADEVVEPTGGVEGEDDAPPPMPATTDEDVSPAGATEEPAQDGSDEESDGIADDEVEDAAGQDLPSNPAQAETTAPTESDPAADEGGEPANDEGALAGEYGVIVIFEADDEES